jgi:hypothetical protein
MWRGRCTGNFQRRLTYFIVADKEAQRQVRALVMPTRDETPISWRSAAAVHGQRAGGQVGAVVFQRDPQRLGQLARPGAEVAGGLGFGAAGEHGVEAFEGFQRADQHAAGPFRQVPPRIQAAVQAVAEVDVRMAGLAEDGASALGQAREAVGGLVSGAQVCLGFDDAPGQGTVAEDGAEQLAGDGLCVPAVESRRQDSHERGIGRIPSSREHGALPTGVSTGHG